MLTITRDQLQALEASMDMAAPIASWLKETRPKPFSLIAPPQLAHMSRTLCRRAAALGATGSKATFLFAGFAADIAPDWDRDPLVRKALAKGDVNGALAALPRTLPAQAWTEMRANASSIGWRLEAPIWNQPAPARVAVAVAATLAATGLKPVQPPIEAVGHAAKEGGPCVQSEDGLYVCAVFAALQSDGGRLQSILRASLARSRDLRAAIASLRLRLLVENEAWV